MAGVMCPKCGTVSSTDTQKCPKCGQTLGLFNESTSKSKALKVPPQVGQLIVARHGKRAIAGQVQKRMPVQRRDIAQMDDLGIRVHFDGRSLFQFPQKPGQGFGPRDRLRRRQPGQLNLPKL